MNRHRITISKIPILLCLYFDYFRFPFHLEYYTEVLDLNKLLDIDDDDPFMQKYHALNE